MQSKLGFTSTRSGERVGAGVPRSPDAGVTRQLRAMATVIAMRARRAETQLEGRAVPVFMLLSASSVAGLWTVDLIRGDKVDRPGGVLSLRDRDTGQNLLPHLIAEYATAGALVAGALGLATEAGWGRTVALTSLGALTYTSINSLSWVVTRRERLPYGAPMMVTLAGSVASLIVLGKGWPPRVEVG